MAFAKLNGITIHYRLEGPGSGPVVVFSNSLGTDFRIWDATVAALPKGWRALRYDKRGHGLSDAPPAPYTMDQHVADLVALMDHVGVERAAICGLSVGGLIGQGLVIAAPERVSKLVLCDTGHKIGTQAIWGERMAAIEAGGISSISEGILTRWFTPAFHASEVFPGYRNMLERTPKAGYLGTASAIAASDFTEGVGGITAPVLCICGREDGATPVALMEALTGLIPGARLEVIEGAGHIPCVEQPEAFSKLLNGFLGAA